MTPGPYDGLARTFDSVAELYEQVRPGYPAQMFEDLSSLLPPGPVRVLEIGAGTGQATRGLLARGWHVVALEPGPELARVARRVLAGLGDVEVVVEPFEQWRGEQGSFDLVLAATSWHWLDPETACARAADCLRPGGVLAVVATEHVLPDGEGDPFFRAVEQDYDAVGMGDGLGGPASPEAVPAPDAAAMAASGLFAPAVVSRYVWSRSYTAEEYLALLSSYSGHIAASPATRQQLFEAVRRRIEARPGGRVRKHYLTMLQTARVLAPGARP